MNEDIIRMDWRQYLRYLGIPPSRFDDIIIDKRMWHLKYIWSKESPTTILYQIIEEYNETNINGPK